MKISVLCGFLIISITGSIAAQQAEDDSVTVTFEVVVPETTPDNAAIYWAGTLNSWDPGDKGSGFSAKDHSQPASFLEGKWTVKLRAPAGSEHSYKYTRGSIFSVEERADYSYRPVREVIFDESKTIHDTVAAWHDIPPKSLAENWPVINLVQSDIIYARNDIVMNGSGTILYDKNIRSRYYDMPESETRVNGIPDSFFDATYYYQRISAYSNKLLLIAAGKTSPEGNWKVFVDINRDQAINDNEKVFTIQGDSKIDVWRGKIPFTRKTHKETFTDSVEITIRHITDLPAGYTSSAYPDAPDLMYELPFKHREGKLYDNTFYVTVSFEEMFSTYPQFSVDYNKNDTLDAGSGSNETTVIDFGAMHNQQQYYIHPILKLDEDYWEVANIDPYGEWIRLRPLHKNRTEQQITKGNPVPSWEAVTVSGDTVNSEKYRGKYLLLDFWGSWCGPCIEELPLLQKVYGKYGKQNFEMIGFAHESAESLARALEEYQLPWPQVLDEKGDYSTKFLVRGYPFQYLVGPDGNVLEMGTALRGEQLISTLEKYLE